MNKLFKIVTLSSVVFGLSSCLKDKGYDEGTTGHDLNGVPKIIELGYANEQGHSKAFAFDFADSEVSANAVYVRLAAGTPASEDITVTIDTTGATAALQAINPDIKVLPSSFYTLDQADMTYTIPSGATQVPIKVTTNAIQFDPSTTYGLYFKLAAVDKTGYNLSGNYGYYIATFGAKNKYDGVYTLVWSNYHPTSNPGYTGSETTIHMVTTAGNKCKIFWPLANGFANPAILGGALNYFGSQEPEYTFNVTTNKVTVQNAFPGATTFYTMNPGYDSHYDPATKKIYAKWGYSYVGGNFDPAASREWTQVFTYTGPR